MRYSHCLRPALAGLVALGASAAFAQPANDGCVGAQVVVPNGTCYSGTTAAATDGWIGTVGCAGNNPEVWYTFMATGAVANFQVTSGTLGGNVEIVLVSSTGPCAGLGLEGSACAPSPVNLDVSFSLVTGNTYYYTVSGSGTPGTFTTCVTTANSPPAPGLDCTTAEPLCNSNSFSQGNFTGIGAVEEISQNGCFGLDERQSKWYTFTCSLSGTFELLVNPSNYVAPTQTGDDFDFSLWDVTNGCYVSANILPVPVSCNWSGCVGSTGIDPAAPFMGQTAGIDYQNNNPAGPGDCLSNQQWNTPAVNLVACRRYALLIDNYTTSSGGFAVAFGGTAIMGPKADFTYSTDVSCLQVTVNRGGYCTGNQMTYQWNFGDGFTSVAGVPATHTYATPGAYTISLTVTDANGCTDSYSVQANIGCVLPIDLVSFEAVPAEDGINLRWTTATEQHNDHFDVLRSQDGVAFAPIGTLPGSGDSQHTVNYALVDSQPIEGVSYYRLRQTDTDGSSTLHTVISVRWARTHVDLVVFPDPARDACTLAFVSAQGGLVEWALLDAFGRTVRLGTRAVETGANRMLLDITGLAQGLYRARITQEGRQRSAPLVID